MYCCSHVFNNVRHLIAWELFGATFTVWLLFLSMYYKALPEKNMTEILLEYVKCSKIPVCKRLMMQKFSVELQ